jgi:SAM-dependent methyltransferase
VQTLKAVGQEAVDSFRDFLASRVEPIPGWLNTEAAQLTQRLVCAQRSAGISGPMLEIGVFKGKYLSVLYELSAPGEAVVGVDLFVGAEDLDEVVRGVRGNIAAACGDDSRLRIVVEDSLRLEAKRLRSEARADGFRFVSIDGGHTREIVYHDLAVAVEVLKPGGVIALDDAFNHTTPGVIEGITEYFFRNKPALAPFAHCYNKLFVTTPDFHARYLEATWRFVEEATWLPTHGRTLSAREGNQAVGYTPHMFGFEIVAFL